MSIQEIINEELDVAFKAAKERISARLADLLLGNGGGATQAIVPLLNAEVLNEKPNEALSFTGKPTTGTQKDEFDNSVLRWIELNPGSYGTEVAIAFGCENMKTPLIANSMARLKTRRALVKKGSSNATVYYKRDGSVPAADPAPSQTRAKQPKNKPNRRTPEENTALRNNIHLFVIAHPNSGGQEIGDSLGVKPKDVSNFADRMVADKRLRRRKKDGRVTYSSLKKAA